MVLGGFVERRGRVFLGRRRRVGESVLGSFGRGTGREEEEEEGLFFFFVWRRGWGEEEELDFFREREGVREVFLGACEVLGRFLGEKRESGEG